MMQLFHWAGAALLPLCGWLTGTAFQAKAQQHIAQLQRTVELLQRIRQEIAYRRPDFAQLLRCLLQEDLLAEFEPADTLQQLAPPGLFTPEERLCFSRCFAGLGQREAAQECERLEYYTARFPGTNAFATSSVAANAPTGTPQPRALATVRISGLTPYCWNANILPVLPIPH